MHASEPYARYRSIIDDWRAFQESIARPLRACVWTNTLRAEATEVARRLAAEAIDAEPVAWYPGAFLLPAGVRPGMLWPVAAGLCQIQEEVSLLPVLLLAPRAEHRVLDLCAAPGNKLAQVAVAMRNRGTIIANDVSRERMRAVRHTLERLGILNVSTSVHDGANYPPSAGEFDRILVDVPCSCEGTCRKNPEVLEEAAGGAGRDGFRGKVAPQKALLRKACRLCRPGGRVVYSTCTFAPEENELVVDAVLKEFSAGSLRLLPASVEGFRCSAGLTEWDGESLHPSLRRTLRIWPHQNDTGGFFVAVIEKAAAPGGEEQPESSAPPSGAGGGIGAAARDALAQVTERFGLPHGWPDAAGVLRDAARSIYLQAHGHRPPAIRPIDASGLRLVRTDMRYPKLTTAGAMLAGSQATRNTVDVDRRQLAEYVLRREIRLRADQLARCTGTGYVLVRFEGAAMGVGLCRIDADGREATLESFFPKGWSRTLG